MPQPSRLKATIDKVTEHADGLRTLAIVPERPAPRFRAGQFLHLAVDPYDPSSHWPESRIFSIASSPSDRARLLVTFSAAGSFTRRMLDLRAGDSVWLKLPYGDFFVETSDANPAVLVAGGTGMTPFIPLLSQDVAPTGPLWLLYGAKTPDLLIYRDAVNKAVTQWKQVNATFFSEQGLVPGITTGRLSADEALRAADSMGDRARANFYLSGPPAMLSSLKTNLVTSGIAVARVHIDAWGAL